MKFSIITATYKRSDCIRRCLDSVVKQLDNGADIEHVVVDDGSSDDTASILEEYSQRYEHIKAIVFPQNRGTNAARNAAIEAASGDWCIILDSDDYFEDHAIKTISEAMEANRDYRYYMFAADDMMPSYISNPLLSKQINILSYKDFLLGKVYGDFIHVIESSIIKSVHFNETIRIYELIYFLDMYKMADKMLFVNKIVTIRERNRPDGATRESIRMNQASVGRQLEASMCHIDKFESDIIKYGGVDYLSNLYYNAMENALLLSNYDCYKSLCSRADAHGVSSPIRFKIINKLRIAYLYKALVFSYLNIKYRVFKHRVK